MLPVFGHFLYCFASFDSCDFKFNLALQAIEKVPDVSRNSARWFISRLSKI